MYFQSFFIAFFILTCILWSDEVLAHAVTRPNTPASASLVRRAKTGAVLDFASERKALLAKYKKKHQNGMHSIRQNIVQEDMVNQNMDIMYYATLEVGTPPRPYSVILDTGSSDLWLQSVACAPCTGKKMDPSSSSTFQATSSPFSLAYGIGSVSGTLVNDVVSIGSSAFTVQNQVWGLVNSTLGTPVPGNIAGLMGLGFKNLAASQATPFWEALVSGGQWVEPVMSFWMTRYTNDSSATDAEFGGEFVMGGTNEALYTGGIDFVPLSYPSDPTFWAIPIQRVTVNGQEIPTSLALAAIDTATSLIGGPPSEVQSIYAAIPNARRGQGLLEGFWTYPCTQKVELTLNFGGRTWPMSSADFALVTNVPDTCIGAIFETSLGDSENAQIPEWYIGASFLKNVYSVFRYDPPAVGFAQLSEATLKNEPVSLANGTTGARSAHTGGAHSGAERSLSGPSFASVWGTAIACISLFLSVAPYLL